MSKHVDYYFSLNSPWTYLGHARFTAIARAAGADVTAHPVDFGIIFPATGGLPVPKRPKERQAYRLVELERWRVFLDVPLNLHPAHWPANDGVASQMVISCRESGADAMGFAGACLRATWAEERDTGDPDTLIQIARSLDLDGDAALAEAKADKHAATRAEESREAIERGVFGAPSWIIDGEVFWGQDRIDFVGRALGVSV